MRFREKHAQIICVKTLTLIVCRLVYLNNDERMIYEHIENSGTTGLWTKALKQRTGIVQTTITKSTKTLEGKGLIKQIKSVKNPTQKVYMLSHLSPGEGVTGGPWHSEGELDMELVGVTADAVVQFIEQKSWVRGYIKMEREPQRERDRSMSPLAPLDEQRDLSPVSKKRKRDGEGDKSKRPQYVKVETQISYEAGYKHYPTVQTILHFIKESGFIKSEVVLTDFDMQGLLDVLVFDDRIEKIGNGYRTIRGVSGATEAMKNMIAGKSGGDLGDEDAGNGLTQAPCGRCPVFDLCEEGGPVNAKNCVYFDAWLRT